MQLPLDCSCWLLAPAGEMQFILLVSVGGAASRFASFVSDAKEPSCGRAEGCHQTGAAISSLDCLHIESISCLSTTHLLHRFWALLVVVLTSIQAGTGVLLMKTLLVSFEMACCWKYHGCILWTGRGSMGGASIAMADASKCHVCSHSHSILCCDLAQHDEPSCVFAL